MYDLHAVLSDCLKKCKELNIPYGHIYGIEPNTRAHSRWGQCRSYLDGYKININIDLLDERNDIKGLEDTVLHEILHTCPRCHGHGEQWKKYASMLNAIGYNIKRTNSSAEKGVSYQRERSKEEYKYFMKCVGCGAVAKQKRMSDFIRYPQRYKCGRCGAKWERITPPLSSNNSII